MKSLLLLALLVLPIYDLSLEARPSESRAKREASYIVWIGGRFPCACGAYSVRDLRPLEPCAWRRAQLEVSRHAPEYTTSIYRIKRGPVRYRNGRFSCDGFYKLHGCAHPKFIEVARTGDFDEDWDTMVHEYKHYIVLRIEGRDSSMHEWVNRVDEGTIPESRSRLR